VRVLVVEDQDSIRRMIEALVQGRGFEVLAVSTGTKAIDISMTTPPDLVLLDLMLPGQYDGFEVCRRLRADPSTKYVPIIVISALDDDQSRARANEAGATAYYTKPFSPIALLKAIDDLRARGRSGPPPRGSGAPAQSSGPPPRGSGAPAQSSGPPPRSSGPPPAGSGFPSRGPGRPDRGSD
jgi:DNA-binding response OmpR family regulator